MNIKNKESDQDRERPVDRAIAHILNGIREGRYAPGQRLIMADLLAETGLGLSAVRDALRYLGGEGAVELIPNKGARIPRFARKDFVDILYAMQAIAIMGFRLAAPKMDRPKNRQRLRHALAELEESATCGFAHEFIAMLPKYHYAVNDISENSYLNFLLDRFHFDFFRRELVNAMIAAAMTPEHWQKYVEQYRQITDAMLRKDAATAETVFAEHIASLVTVVGGSS